MDASNVSIKSSISCGGLKRVTDEFRGGTTMEQVRTCVTNLFDGEVPLDYSIMFYDKKKKKFAVLNDVELQSGNGPFDLFTYDLLFGSENYDVSLFVVDNAMEHSTETGTDEFRKHVE